MKKDFAFCLLSSLSVGLFLVLFVAAATFLRRHEREPHALQPEVVRDTVRDTVRVAVPAVHDSVVLGWVEVRAPRVKDTPWACTDADTLRASALKDSATVLLPMERKVYADSAYRAVVSGIGVRLDSMTVYPRTITVTHTLPSKTPRRWGVGVQAGVGLTPKGVQPYAGLGAYYRIF